MWYFEYQIYRCNILHIIYARYIAYQIYRCDDDIDDMQDRILLHIMHIVSMSYHEHERAHDICCITCEIISAAYHLSYLLHIIYTRYIAHQLYGCNHMRYHIYCISYLLHIIYIDVIMIYGLSDIQNISTYQGTAVPYYVRQIILTCDFHTRYPNIYIKSNGFDLP